MASKAKAAQTKDEAPEKEAEGAPDSPLPLLDLSDAGVKKMIKAAKKRGYVTHDQINAVLPSEEVTSDQIEDVFAMISEMGINVVENDDADSDDNEEKATDEHDDDDEDTGHRARRDQGQVARHHREEGAHRAHRRSGAHVLARDGLGRAACRARARSPSPSASRPAARP